MIGLTRHRYERERTDLLRRFLDISDDGLTDPELLELILAGEPRWIDAGIVARHLLATFGTLTKAIHADEQALRAVEGMNSLFVGRLKLQRLTLRRTLKSEIQTESVIASWSALMDYCKLTMGYNKVEEFRVLFLNHRHALIADEVMQRGTVNHTPVYTREVVKRALEHSAAGMILLHNHPSGDPTPSKADVDITRKIADASALMSVTVHDHVIITETGHYSFKSSGLLDVDPPALAPSQDTIAPDLPLPPTESAHPQPQVTH